MTRVHVLVPYRDRENHLKCFLKDFVPCLKKHINDVKITIVEQSDDGKLFNRGKLLNIGVCEAGEDSTHFILQDIDTFANDFCVKQLYRIQEHHEDIVRINVPHNNSLGCICKITSDAMYKINGFPNVIFGWGIEDRALYWRAKIKEISMSSDKSSKHSFRVLDHKSNVRRYTGDTLRESDKWKELAIKKMNPNQKKELVESDGLNNVNYKVLKKKIIEHGVEMITVSL